MESFIKILLVSGFFFLGASGCFLNSRSKEWKSINNYFLSDTITLSGVKSRMSEDAYRSIQEKGDGLRNVKTFFKALSENSKLKIVKQDSFTYVVFNYDDPLVGGPSLAIKNINSNWIIEDIRFGK